MKRLRDDIEKAIELALTTEIAIRKDLPAVQYGTLCASLIGFRHHVRKNLLRVDGCTTEHLAAEPPAQNIDAERIENVGCGETERERGYIEGRRQTLLDQLRQALVGLHSFGSPEDDPILKLTLLVAERHSAVRALRDVCEEFGDNDWNDEDFFADVIEKHLHRNLRR